MKPSNPDGLLDANPSQPPLHRGGARVTLPLFETGSQQNCGIPASIPLAGARGSWRGLGFNGQSCLIATLLLICTPTANAVSLGRIFFTPEQRAQFDYAYARNAPVEGSSSPFLTVNGIVQKQGGARTVWINGVSQSMGNSIERNPATQTVTISGKPQPIRIKVGEKILLDQPAPKNQDAPSE